MFPLLLILLFIMINIQVTKVHHHWLNIQRKETQPKHHVSYILAIFHNAHGTTKN